MKLHTETRSKKMITHLSNLGLSVTYDRVENQLATSVCEDFTSKGVVVPSQLRCGLFTVGALDNIDHNPTSTTAKSSFHGTGISLFQFPTALNIGEGQDNTKLLLAEGNNYKLPESFTTVPAVALKTANVSIPQQSTVSLTQLEHALLQEKSWLVHACQQLEKDETEENDAIAWSAFHATKHTESANRPTTLTQLLPLFYEKAATAAMIRHGMTVLRSATEFLHPGQIPVMAFDAPLFALAKSVQWKWPDTHGEEKFIVMFGGLQCGQHMVTTWRGLDGPIY